ncbi:hypothetical protein BFO01nite_22260 [Brevibacillus formosus]|uniref:Tc1-like transposase DDE domain-containing protein n=1 Tax=Brevibacillus formosus TaxID=54913 RepID=A0ABQ0T7F3_9BACL|nr:hypothetical protein BFO01nite_22260 [Brevibacillus formosus]
MSTFPFSRAVKPECMLVFFIKVIAMRIKDFHMEMLLLFDNLGGHASGQTKKPVHSSNKQAGEAFAVVSSGFYD